MCKVGGNIKVISLFTGAGGLDLGFEQVGFETIYAGDIDELCCRTLLANKGKALSTNMEVVQGDIRKLDLEGFPQGADLVIGGPPCQSFSASGRRAGGAPGRLDERGTLFEAYVKVIKKVKPQAFLFENVRGILGTNEGKDWKAIVSTFENIGYNISYRILDALDYGAPQQRERLLMVGHKMPTPFLFPEPLYGPDSSSGAKHISAGEALQGLNDTEDMAELRLSGGKYGHLLPLVPPGDNYLFFTDKRGYSAPIFAYRSRFSDFLYKANPNLPIKTLIASPGKYTGPFHWDSRRFSIAEYKRLQGFPDDYIFVGDRSDIVQQIGNSVSPKLSRWMALAIAKQIFSRDVDMNLLPSDKALSFDRRKSIKAQKTREHHETVSLKKEQDPKSIFSFKSYTAYTIPSSKNTSKHNTTIYSEYPKVKIVVRSDGSRRLFARMNVTISQNGKFDSEPDVLLEVIAYGESEFTIQTMWNAIDNWVTNCSNFHSLFELYGHFTEPHPIFKVTNFEAHTDHPIAQFGKHCADYSNCSTYFPRAHLTELFGVTFKQNSFISLVNLLRGYRFDIRCVETNLTMPKDKYMVCYPFTLPPTKQMNFSVKAPTKNKTKINKAPAISL